MITQANTPAHMRNVRLTFSDEAKRTLAIIDKRKDREYAALWRSIQEKEALLIQNPAYGTKIQRHLLPKEYVIKYGVDNLWKIDLANHWRMIYTLDTNEVRILAFIIDIMDHPYYDKKFGYRKKR